MVTALIVLTLVASSCQTSKVNTIYEPELIKVYPKLNFPKQPDPTGKALPLKEGEYRNFTVIHEAYDSYGKEIEVDYVAVPFWYWKLLSTYFYEIRGVKAQYDAFCEKIENTQ